MRPSTAKQRINNVLWTQFVDHGDIKTKSISELVLRLKKIAPELKKMHAIAYIDYPDDRGGHETYGYENDKEIRGNLNHVSDRWNATFRIRWLLDLIKEEQNKENTL